MEGRKTILIADDVRLNRVGFQNSLSEIYHVIEAQDGKEAVEIMEKTKIDLLILDIVMPVMDGIEVLKYRQSHPKLLQVSVIVVTALDNTDMEIEVLDLGADDVLRKPFDYRVLQRRIENVINSRSAAALLEENQMLKRVQRLESQLVDMTWKQQEYTRLFYALLNYIPGGVAIFEVKKDSAKIIFANQSVCGLFGYGQDEYIELVSENAFIGAHPDDLEGIYAELERAVGNNADFNRSFRNRKKNGEYIWITLQISIIERDDERIMGYGSYTDIGILKERAEKDSLTGIYNRQAFKELVAAELARKEAKRRALLMIDLDNFKAVNDTFGHISGDEVLKDVAGRIQAVFRGEDIVARLGGDEFCVFVTRAMPKDIVVARAGQLAGKLDILIEKEDKVIHLSASIGIAYSDDCGLDYEKLYKSADVAQYYAKNHGKNCFCIAGEEEVVYHNNSSGQEWIRL